jgi:hypothetical protein
MGDRFSLKGLYALMFSKPDDWIFHEAALMAESTEGRDAVRAAMKELAMCGWLQKIQPRASGQFAGNVYRLNITVDWKPVDGLTVDGKSTSTKSENNKTEETSPPTPRGPQRGSERV